MEKKYAKCCGKKTKQTTKKIHKMKTNFLQKRKSVTINWARGQNSIMFKNKKWICVVAVVVVLATVKRFSELSCLS